MSKKLEIIVSEANQPSEKAIQDFTERLYELMMVTEQRENNKEFCFDEV